MKDMYTIDVSQVSQIRTTYNRPFLEQSRIGRLSREARKLPSLRSDKTVTLSPERAYGLGTTNIERTNTKEPKSEKIYVPLFHSKKLELS